MVSSIVSNLIAASALDGAELYYGVQGSADRKVTGAQIKTLTSDSPTLITPTVVTSLTGSVGSDITFAGGAAADATANAPAVSFTAAVGGATSGHGGGYTQLAGNATGEGNGGGFNLTAGRGGATSGSGGSFSIEAGSVANGATSGTGGEFAIYAGNGGTTGNGGAISLNAGQGGATSGGGGDITLTPGTVTSGTLGHIKLVGIENFADDAAAATGGIPVTGLYRTASVLKIRVA